jgi:hypothetical protein
MYICIEHYINSTTNNGEFMPKKTNEAWYTRDNYYALQDFIEDWNRRITYYEWHDNMQITEHKITMTGVKFIRVYVDINTLDTWLRANAKRPTMQGIRDFVGTFETHDKE